jgi:uncharacterized protein (TIGR03435 family)
MLAGAPAWVTTERITIEAKAPAKTTKDQFRVMMQSLLAERFKLAVHYETREAPVFALTLVTPGKFGPRLQPHADNPRCDPAAAPATPTELFTCGNIALRRAPYTGRPSWGHAISR